MAEVNLAEIKFGVAVGDRQTAKLNSPPNFSAIRYISAENERERELFVPLKLLS